MAAQVLAETRDIVILARIAMGSVNIVVVWVMDALAKPRMEKENAKKFVKVLLMRYYKLYKWFEIRVFYNSDSTITGHFYFV